MTCADAYWVAAAERLWTEANEPQTDPTPGGRPGALGVDKPAGPSVIPPASGPGESRKVPGIYRRDRHAGLRAA
jgi:hypothetical protein